MCLGAGFVIFPCVIMTCTCTSAGVISMPRATYRYSLRSFPSRLCGLEPRLHKCCRTSLVCIFLFLFSTIEYSGPFILLYHIVQRLCLLDTQGRFLRTGIYVCQLWVYFGMLIDSICSHPHLHDLCHWRPRPFLQDTRMMPITDEAQKRSEQQRDCKCSRRQSKSSSDVEWMFQPFLFRHSQAFIHAQYVPLPCHLRRFRLDVASTLRFPGPSEPERIVARYNPTISQSLQTNSSVQRTSGPWGFLCFFSKVNWCFSRHKCIDFIYSRSAYQNPQNKALCVLEASS
jgi:hypothetical protein